MDWTEGMQRALDYIEEHLTEELSYETIAAQSFCSSYHFQRSFSILFGCTLGEYIRARRLTLAGAELTAGKCRVIDAALLCGYESPDSFARAFQKFHGFKPSQARGGGAMLRSFSRLNVQKDDFTGGTTMEYKIDKKPAMVLTGFKRHFSGTPAEREDQECDFYMSTRTNQYLLRGLARDCETFYNVMTHFDDEGYDFYIAAKLNKAKTENLAESIGEDAKRFERIPIPEQLYLICETERCEYPTMVFETLRRRMVGELLPATDYELAEAPELCIYHWFTDDEDSSVKNTRYAELWLPIRKKEA
ncbi:MAG: AraC family transcriptional regulator [Oscillospiraceae bacterium]|nr:AraC family transcriptional regulator [Oscillospiraceae bacterium]